jgi:hypothetical protein
VELVDLGACGQFEGESGFKLDILFEEEAAFSDYEFALHYYCYYLQKTFLP